MRYPLILSYRVETALTKYRSDHSGMSVGKAVNQLLQHALMDEKYLPNPEGCQHEYEWLPIHGSLAKRYACKTCLQRPVGRLGRNIVYAPGWEGSAEEEDEALPEPGEIVDTDPMDLPEVQEEIVS